MVADAFERLDHGNRDVGANMHCSHPTGSASAVDAVPARRVGVVVFVVIAALCSLITGAISANHENDPGSAIAVSGVRHPGAGSHCPRGQPPPTRRLLRPPPRSLVEVDVSDQPRRKSDRLVVQNEFATVP